VGRPRKVQERPADVQLAREIASDIWPEMVADLPEGDVLGHAYAYKCGIVKARVVELCEALGVEVAG